MVKSKDLGCPGYSADGEGDKVQFPNLHSWVDGNAGRPQAQGKEPGLWVGGRGTVEVVRVEEEWREKAVKSTEYTIPSRSFLGVGRREGDSIGQRSEEQREGVVWFSGQENLAHQPGPRRPTPVWSSFYPVLRPRELQTVEVIDYM